MNDEPRRQVVQLDTGPNTVEGLAELKLACRMCCDALEEGDLIGFHVHILDTGQDTGGPMTASVTLLTRVGKAIAIARIPGRTAEAGGPGSPGRTVVTPANSPITTALGPDCAEVTLEAVQALVGGNVEMLTLPGGDQLFFNEDGRMLELAHNNHASILAQRHIVGDAVLLRGSARWT